MTSPPKQESLEAAGATAPAQQPNFTTVEKPTSGFVPSKKQTNGNKSPLPDRDVVDGADVNIEPQAGEDSGPGKDEQERPDKPEEQTHTHEPQVENEDPSPFNPSIYYANRHAINRNTAVLQKNTDILWTIQNLQISMRAKQKKSAMATPLSPSENEWRQSVDAALRKSLEAVNASIEAGKMNDRIISRLQRSHLLHTCLNCERNAELPAPDSSSLSGEAAFDPELGNSNVANGSTNNAWGQFSAGHLGLNGYHSITEETGLNVRGNSSSEPINGEDPRTTSSAALEMTQRDLNGTRNGKISETLNTSSKRKRNAALPSEGQNEYENDNNEVQDGRMKRARAPRANGSKSSNQKTQTPRRIGPRQSPRLKRSGL
ncbi:hypothetical protein TWF730_009376 [Orbilia blumenaviensis]|uniref:Uncharacterized protein n=1 Tax=Orbilia blumenaviensis TaxID=1796055 RepID=A0AAV9UY39_9PEZI